MGGLEHPWGLDFLPNGSILITERSGDLILLAPDGKSTKVMGTPDVLASGQGGLLDVKVDTDFNTTKKNLIQPKIFFSIQERPHRGRVFQSVSGAAPEPCVFVALLGWHVFGVRTVHRASRYGRCRLF